MAKMKAVQVPKPGADFEIIEKEIPQPGPGQVRIRVQACGICHSDSVVKENLLPGITYPRVPGHEVAGVIDEVGGGVTTWKKGQRVGVGWHGGQDGTCLACRRGDFTHCAHLKVCGISYDGGDQEFMVAPIEALAQMPESLDAAEAAPLMCAGITTFNALRHSGALPSDLVAIQGIGGLGHLGIQFAQKFGYQWRLWDADQRMRRLRKSSERMFTSIARQQILRRNCRSLAVRGRFWRPPQAASRWRGSSAGWGPTGRW